MTRQELDTPALVLDLDAFERNVAKMAAHARRHNLALRPHAKTHKCPEVARAQLEAGARGICTAKLSEAEVFAESGIRGLLITTAVVGAGKIRRAVRLALAAPDTIFVVDDLANARDLNDAAEAAGARLHAAIELHVGRRSGIAPGAAAVALAQNLLRLPGLRFAGLQAYAGFASHTVGFEARRQTSREALAPAVETRCLLEKAGIETPLLSSGSTGTYNIDAEIQGLTELQPGSYIFMDLDYLRIGGQDSETFTDFECALTVLATVVSRPERHKAIVDAGLKAFSTDKPFAAAARGLAGVEYYFAGDEHGRLELAPGAPDLRVGDRVEFLVPHCDPTVNLYDHLHACRGEQVEAVWSIAARGKCQ